MKKAISILVTVLVAYAAASASAGERGLTVLLAGDNNANSFLISLSSDGRSYLIESNAPLKVGGGLCTHPEANPNRLQCEAAAIAGFEVNAGGGPDRVVLGHELAVPATLRGGPGDDKLIGGAGDDKLIGGAGNDWLFGGAGSDRLFGGPGDDRLVGGPGENVLVGGPGRNEVS
jgi:RTX calcium-binding nonapeptide repeat (4 copies)